VHVPILKQGGYLIATIQSVLSDADLLQLRDDLAGRVGQFRSRGVIIDVTVLDVIDSFATRTLRGVAHMLKLRGADTVIVGIQPDVAFAMVQLGLTLEGVGTALDLEEGLAFLNARAKRGGVVARTGSAAAPRSSPPKPLPGVQFKRGGSRT
jgi:rsbT antagonist protein RsbS